MNSSRWRQLRLVASVGLAMTALVTVTLSTQVQRGRATTVIDGREAVEGEVLVQFRDTTGTFEQARAAEEIDADHVESLGRRGAKRMRARRMSTQQLLARLRSNPDVEFAEPNHVVRLSVTPNDPSFGNLWGLFNFGQNYGGAGIAGADIDAPLAWDVSTGSRANVIGIVDSGVDYNHPDLAANMWTAPSAFSVTIGGVVINCAAGTRGFNAITNTCNPMDDHSHGTHVAGTIGAVGNNGVGVVGVNWTASMMALKFLDSTGFGSVANAIKAIEFAVQAKAVLGNGVANVRVLNNSWGGDGFSQSLLNQINRANNANMLFVASAGNAGVNIDTSPQYPASYSAPNIITVAATNNRDQRAWFSNYGAASVHLGAPGEAILSTTPNNTYSAFNGTSMAAPHVSGTAALVLSKCSLTTAALKTLVLNTVDPIASMSGITTTGGRLNANNAIRACAPTTASVPNVVGLTQAAATTAITNVGLVVGTVTTAASATVPAGSVISQTPVGGTVVAIGSAVNLVVSTGPATVAVPNVIGLTQGAATTVITGAGLVVGTVTTATSTTVPAGNVISQTPVGGTVVAIGSAVNLVVSSGPPAATRLNVAASANGGTAVASSSYSMSHHAPAGAIDGNRRGTPWASNAAWVDATPYVRPDWLEVRFATAQPISEINVFSMQDDPFTAPVEPYLGQTFSVYGVTDFQVQYWTGAQWALVPGGSVAGNNQVWRQLLFAPVTTTAIRVTVTGARDAAWTQLTEVEAWSTTAPIATVNVPNVVGFTQAAATTAITNVGLVVGIVTAAPSATVPAGSVISQTPVGGTSVTVGSAVNLVVSSGPPAATRLNVAASANGGTAVASSSYSMSHHAPAGAIDGNRRGTPWASNAAWVDATPYVRPDWLEVRFATAQPISEINVFSMQDDPFTAPVEPYLGQTFSVYGVTDFQVQYWTGAQWALVPGGSIAGNNQVWRQLLFAPVTTTAIRVTVTGARDAAWTQLTEVEAWSTGATSTSMVFATVPPSR